MTRVTVMVCMWLLLVGSLSDGAAAGLQRSPLQLLLVYAAATAVTALALWLQFQDDDESDPQARRLARRRARWHPD